MCSNGKSPGGVEESERSAFNCPNANDLSAFDFFVFAKLR